MKLRDIFTLTCIVGGIIACEEDTLYPRSEDVSSLSRFEFPQGNNAWDQDLQTLANEFTTIPIYRGFDTLDLNRKWTGTAEIKYAGKGLNGEYAEFYTDFIKNHIFAFLKPELTQGVLPQYIFLTDELRDRQQQGDYSRTFYWGGLDFWAICLHVKDSSLAEVNYGGNFIIKMSYPIDLPQTSWEYKARRTIFLAEIARKIVEEENIEIPPTFSNIDYTTANTDFTNQNAENYYLKKGIMDVITHAPAGYSDKYDFTKNSKTTTNNATTNFYSYIQLALRYTRDSVLIQYPQEKFPKIIEYYDFTVNYLKEKYDWDVTKAAEEIPVN